MLTVSLDTEISERLISGYIKKHELEVPRLERLGNYYRGEHDILNRIKDCRLANNRLVCNHAKYIADTAVGYLAGNPVRYTSKNGKQDLSMLLTWLAAADSDTQDIDLAKNCAVYGQSLEMLYMSDEEKPSPRLASLDPRRAFVVYDESVENKPVFGVYYYPLYDGNDRAAGYGCYVSADEYVRRYELHSDFSFKAMLEESVNPFGEVSIIEYYNNSDCLGDFEQATSLIDAYNVLQSDRVNDKEQFVKSILLIKGQILGDDEKEESEAYRRILEMGLLMVDNDTDVEWLSRQLDEQSVEILRRSLEQDIHKFCNVPCLTDQSFGANASGVAMRYKLLGFEQMTKIKERYFKEGLRIRLRLFANALLFLGKTRTDLSDIDISFVRSLPVNELEIAQTIECLKDMVPDEQLLALLPFIKDPALSVKRVNKSLLNTNPQFK